MIIGPAATIVTVARMAIGETILFAASPPLAIASLKSAELLWAIFAIAMSFMSSYWRVLKYCLEEQ